MSCSSIITGIQISERMPVWLPWKTVGATPTIVNGCWLIMRASKTLFKAQEHVPTHSFAVPLLYEYEAYREEVSSAANSRPVVGRTTARSNIRLNAVVTGETASKAKGKYLRTGID